MPVVIMFFIMPVVIMFFVMPVVIMFFIMPMVIMFFVMPMVIMPVIIKGAAFTECDPGQTMTVQQGQCCRTCRDAIDRFFKKGFQFVTDPEYQISVLQLSCL